ncbi:MAG TPA: hypothetical protein PLD73_09035 [Candidatus Hydrogenedentes bacterium]|jgi:hypothetical protein|nr:hypothetical protein [Candidatus Hydrogenedentota bacterium]HPJ99105.1 hypothetical protein [Candidatus Hydrogenedentota bacterium]
MLLLVLSATGGNLLLNPGFESVRDNAPLRWDLYVMPRAGCQGELDSSIAHEGQYSVKLHNETPYGKEPANNWSQSITTNLRNRELRVSGWLKTQGATEAALWLQCFQRNPLRILALESTTHAQLITGDTDWTEVEMRVTVPNETDFVMFRCVLLGEGTAWFDDVSVEDAPEHISTPPEAAVAEAVRKEAPPQAPPASKDSAQLEELRISRQALADANRTLRELNTSLLTQITELQVEIEQLRQEIQDLRLQEEAERTEAPPTPSVPQPEMPVPPLVPHVPPIEKEQP